MCEAFTERRAGIRCDGCGQPADAEHIQRRIQRLELATRFRPIHISVLFVIPGPPLALEDYFYYLANSADAPARDTPSAPSYSKTASQFFDDLLEGCGIVAPHVPHDSKGMQATTSVLPKEAALGEFQRRGFFLADCPECPLHQTMPTLAASPEEQRLIDRSGPTLIKRIRYSYKPHHVVLLSAELQPLLGMLGAAGLGDRLLLHRGRALPLPSFADASRLQFRQALAELLAEAAQPKTV